MENTVQMQPQVHRFSQSYKFLEGPYWTPGRQRLLSDINLSPSSTHYTWKTEKIIWGEQCVVLYLDWLLCTVQPRNLP